MTTSWLLWCGAGSGALHLAVYQAQRRIHHGPDTPGGLPFAAIVAAYVLATCGLFALYSAVLLLCRRGWITTPRNRRLVIGIPVVFNLALVGTLPTLSIDVYSYLAHGYVQAGLRQNPYLIGARAVAGTSFGREIAGYGWRPVHPVSPYGPVLTHLEHAVVATTRNVRAQIVLIKAVAVTATLASAALIWLLLGRVTPQVQLLGTVVFLWNPMVIWELAGEGHNDAVMFVFMLAAMALILCERHIGGITALSLAILTKYVPVLLVPLCAAYAWRTTGSPGRLLVRAGVAVALAAAVTVILFLPLWAGLDTFSGVRLNGAPGTTGSTPTVVLESLDRLAPHVSWQRIVWAIVLLASFICPVLMASRVTDAPGLLRATAVMWLLVLARHFADVLAVVRHDSRGAAGTRPGAPFHHDGHRGVVLGAAGRPAGHVVRS